MKSGQTCTHQIISNQKEPFRSVNPCTWGVDTLKIHNRLCCAPKWDPGSVYTRTKTLRLPNHITQIKSFVQIKSDQIRSNPAGQSTAVRGRQHAQLILLCSEMKSGQRLHQDEDSSMWSYLIGTHDLFCDVICTNQIRSNQKETSSLFNFYTWASTCLIPKPNPPKPWKWPHTATEPQLQSPYPKP